MKKIRILLFAVFLIVLCLYIYTILLMRNNTRKVIKKDMQSVSSILHAANLVLLDVEQSIEEKYAALLYSAAVKIGDSGKTRINGLDVALYKKNGEFRTISGQRFIPVVKPCIDTLKELPVALNCKDFYIYVYPGENALSVVGLLRNRVENEKAKVGLERFFNELSKVGFFFYVALEDMDGIVYSTIDKRFLSPLNEDSTLLKVYIEGEEKTRFIDFLGKKILETVLPFSYGSFRGIMRVGLDASDYYGMEKKMFIEITLLYAWFFLTSILVIVYLKKAKVAQMGYKSIREVLMKTEVPVVVQKEDILLLLSGDNRFLEVIKNRGFEEGYVFVDDKRYLVKKIDAGEEKYFLFLSMEEEDIKRKILEYEALGRIIGEVAHEIKNPLNGISTLIQAMNMESPIQEYKEIMEQIKRIEENLNRFVSLVAPLRLHRECVSQREIIEESMNLLGLSEGDKVKVEGDVKLRCDKSKMREVYVNLLKNAKEASQDGRIRVRIGVRSIVFINKGNISTEALSRVFDPFFTTKANGTGIGMYYVKKIINSHGWNVEIKNKKDEVEVKIEFPEDSRC